MYFYVVDLTGPQIEQVFPGYDDFNIFYVSSVSHKYETDIECVIAVEEMLEMIVQDEQDYLQIEVNFNPDFFPKRDITEQQEEEDLEIIEKHLMEMTGQTYSKDEIDNMIFYDDLILCSYQLVSNDAVILTADILTDVDTYKTIDFETNRTVH
jgi:hypothetical protein